MEFGTMNRGGLPFDGKVSELAIYEGQMDIADIINIEADIMARNGL